MSGGKVCARVGNGQISQMTKGELYEKYPNFTDNCKGDVLGKGILQSQQYLGSNIGNTI